MLAVSKRKLSDKEPRCRVQIRRRMATRRICQLRFAYNLYTFCIVIAQAHARRILLPERLAWVEGIAHRLADEDQQRKHDGHREKARQPEPWRLKIGLALRQHLAQRRRAWRQ